VFLKVWENRKNLKTDSSFKSYLFTIAYRIICNVFRKRENHRKSIEKITWEVSGFDTSTVVKVDFDSVLDRVDELVAGFPKTQRTVFLKSRVDGMSSKQIARKLNLSQGTVDNYISASLKLLRNKIGTDDLILLTLALFFIS
jgi:RNA polymerase sigma-70 factor (ECF subfamily)